MLVLYDAHFPDVQIYKKKKHGTTSPDPGIPIGWGGGVGGAPAMRAPFRRCNLSGKRPILSLERRCSHPGGGGVGSDVSRGTEARSGERCTWPLDPLMSLHPRVATQIWNFPQHASRQLHSFQHAIIQGRLLSKSREAYVQATVVCGSSEQGYREL